MNDAENFLEALSSISNKELGHILKNLTDYAANKLDSWGFIPRSEDGSVSGSDFAQEAFKRAIEGKRKWNKNTHPDIGEFLRMVVVSLIRNHLKRTKKSPILTQDFKNEYLEDDDDLHSDLIDNSPHEVQVTADDWTRIELIFDDDFDGYIFFTDWLDNLSPREIAKKYCADVEAVYRKIKKGKGIVKKVFSS